MKKQLKPKQIVVRFSEEDYSTLEKMSVVADKGIGTIIREIVRDCLKSKVANKQ